MAATSKAVTDEEIEEIIARVASGLTLVQSCKKSKKDYVNINKRINVSHELKLLYSLAREDHMRYRVQIAHEIAKNPKIEPARANVMINLIKWEVSRVLPKEFGDRVQQEVIITNNTTLSQRMSTARARAEAKRATLLTPATSDNDVES